jgi:isopentenyl diphosphate isomerase/L-lactate dehydrogenase-like FMN-dependent dehydrogenase
VTGPRFVTVDDYEPVARERLPRDVYDFYAGGAGDEWTLAENRRAFERWVIRPRMLTDAYPPDLAVEVLGRRLEMPILIAPWAYQRMAHPDGEEATARAAATAGTIMVVSSAVHDRLEEVAAATDAPKWWQLYVFTDREYTAEMLKRVVASGFEALCFTVDLPVIGLRHRDTRHDFDVPVGLPHAEFVFDANITWDDIPWVREHAPVPLLLKGIMTAEDARLAVDAGVDGIVVSNHGARQLDTVAATITVLPEIVDAVGGRIPVLVDGGIRRGTDVFKALALGASAVLVGRAAAWGLAVDGEQGVVSVLRILREELENAMSLAGTHAIADITRSFVAPA